MTDGQGRGTDHIFKMVAISIVSIGSSLITLKYVGEMEALLLATPGFLAFGTLIPGAIGGFSVVLRAAYEDIRPLLPWTTARWRDRDG